MKFPFETDNSAISISEQRFYLLGVLEMFKRELTETNVDDEESWSNFKECWSLMPELIETLIKNVESRFSPENSITLAPPTTEEKLAIIATILEQYENKDIISANTKDMCETIAKGIKKRVMSNDDKQIDQAFQASEALQMLMDV